MTNNQLFGMFLVTLLFYLSYVGTINISHKQLLTVFILNIAIFFLLSNSVIEGLTATSNEAIQNLGSVYNSTNATLTNLQITGTLKVGNSILMNGDSSAMNKIEIYQNSDGTDPKFYFDNTGKFGTSGQDGSYISPSSTMFSGDVSVGSNLSLDKTLKVGNSVLMNGDPTATNKIEIYQNSDGLDPKFYFDNTGKFGTSGPNGSYISPFNTMLNGMFELEVAQ